MEWQYQEENLPRTWVRGFRIPIGRCVRGAKRVHRPQTSGALGAAPVQGGPEEAVTLGVLMAPEAEASWDALRQAAHRNESWRTWTEQGRVQAQVRGHGQ